MRAAGRGGGQRALVTVAALLLLAFNAAIWYPLIVPSGPDGPGGEETPVGPGGPAGIARSPAAPGAPPATPAVRGGAPRVLLAEPRENFGQRNPRAVVFWDSEHPDLPGKRAEPPAGRSNIARRDYAGPESCVPCHRKNHRDWWDHPHRLMNARAIPENVRGDFGGAASIDYRGGRATFFQVGGGGGQGQVESGGGGGRDPAYRMRLERGGIVRTYGITRTVGSRFYQYYVGRLLEGPEGATHPARNAGHLLPFGYWLERRAWVPVVHIFKEVPDAERTDPFAAPSAVHYDLSCSACHTTKAFGDWLLTRDSVARMELYAPRPTAFDAASYLAENWPPALGLKTPLPSLTTDGLNALSRKLAAAPSEENAVTLGVSCEACHLGSREHAETSTAEEGRALPLFFPASPHLQVAARPPGSADAWERHPENANFVCARCHTGSRTRYADGTATWNSTEYTDAVMGSCYDRGAARTRGMEALSCIHCHSPHRGIGQRWTAAPENDDARCLHCHTHLSPPAARLAHTRHRGDGPGSRCMNCHMPKINEGMQDMVRTHRITVPTAPANLEANHPNACNLCHLDRPIDWTLKHLESWFGRTYDPAKIARNYPRREGPVGTGWLRSEHPATRLAAAEALGRARARWALPELVEMLDDPYLVHRQFTQRRLEDWLGLRLADHGYRFYQFAAEREKPLARVRAALLGGGPEDAAPPGGARGQDGAP